jgi:hypothetical protein
LCPDGRECCNNLIQKRPVRIQQFVDYLLENFGGLVADRFDEHGGNALKALVNCAAQTGERIRSPQGWS